LLCAPSGFNARGVHADRLAAPIFAPRIGLSAKGRKKRRIRPCGRKNPHGRVDDSRMTDPESLCTREERLSPLFFAKMVLLDAFS
jgi:hypothetical protein